MSRFTPAQKIKLLKATQRRNNLVALLDSFEWKPNGYNDKFEWMREMFGIKPEPDLLIECQQLLENEGLL
jgi:hypothetical protein